MSLLKASARFALQLALRVLVLLVAVYAVGRFLSSFDPIPF